MRLGILGGTFDPVHLGHLIIAEEARVHLSLQRVLFIPAGQPWLKEGRAISPGVHRLAMVRLAVQDNPFFAVSSVEVDHPGPSYTIDTLAALRREYEEAADIYFILGLDALHDLHRWHEPAGILRASTLVAVARPGSRRFAPSSLEELLPGASRRVLILPCPLIGISGTEIRRRVAEGRSIRYFVPRAVAEYIQYHSLYQRSEQHERGAARADS
ncbi:MAG: nicotinate-nucleotide adenylyltransferase [Chloroflexi bacterium]|nr:nicotinate-nucleotide adenylyltransferase [Chloroflexota bacterium]